MSKRATITDKMIVDAAFEIARTQGSGVINARSIAAEIGCTTQPVLYHFSSVAEIKDEVYYKAEELYAEYVSDINGRYKSALLEFMMQYIKFAEDEKYLFIMIFQSERFVSKSFEEIISGDEVQPVIDYISEETGVTKARAKKIFACCFLPAHGIAGMIASGAMEYDEKNIVKILKNIYEPIIADVIQNKREYNFDIKESTEQIENQENIMSRGILNIKNIFDRKH